jgi:hypothetical protein
MKEISEILMKCIECLAEKEEKDFLGKEICYKCQYKKKIGRSSCRGERKCRTCQRLLLEHRWVYCSKQCANIGGVKMKKEYWIKNRVQ